MKRMIADRQTRTHPDQRRRLLGVGIATLDIVNSLAEYPPEDAEVRAMTQRRTRGGNAANSLTVLAQLGHDCHWCGTLAEDADGDFIRADLHRQGIGLALDIRLPGTTTPTSYIVLSQSTGSRTIVHYRDLPELDAVTFDRVALDGFDWVHFEGRHPSETRRMITRVRAERPETRISVELEKRRPGIESLLDGPQVLLVSRTYALALGFETPEDCLRDLAQRTTSAELIVLGWGTEGACYLTRDAVHGLGDTLGRAPAYPPRQVVDTLGAGDCLNAAVIDGLLRGLDPETTVERAVRLAGFKCGHHGFEGLVAAAGSQILNSTRR